jgi:hypothetical protein
VGWLLALELPSVRDICLVTGDPPLIALDAADDGLLFFSAHSGAFYGGETLPRPDARDPLGNRPIALLDTLRAPNGALLPRVRIGAMTVLSAYDGRLHVIQSGERAVKLAIDGEPVNLLRDHAAEVLAVGLDRELGTVGVLTDDGALHVFQQHVAVGTYSVGVARGYRPSVFLPDAAGTIIVGDEERTRVFDMAGRLLAQAPCPAMLGAAEVAPAGEWIIRYGGMRGAIQAYDARLTVVRQGAGEDLRAASRSVQLFPAEKVRDGEIEALALADDGLLAFVQGQTLCCAHLSTLAPLPSEQTLL